MVQAGFDGLVAIPVPREQAGGCWVIAREACRFAIGHYADEIMRTKLRRDKIDERVERLDWALQSPACEDDQERPVRDWFRLESRAAAQGRRVPTWRADLGESSSREVADLLNDSILQNSEISRTQVGHRVTAAVDDPNVHGDHNDPRAKLLRRWLPSILVTCIGCAGEEQSHKGHENHPGPSRRVVLPRTDAISESHRGILTAPQLPMAFRC